MWDLLFLQFLFEEVIAGRVVGRILHVSSFISYQVSLLIVHFWVANHIFFMDFVYDVKSLFIERNICKEN